MHSNAGQVAAIKKAERAELVTYLEKVRDQTRKLQTSIEVPEGGHIEESRLRARMRHIPYLDRMYAKYYRLPQFRHLFYQVADTLTGIHSTEWKLRQYMRRNGRVREQRARGSNEQQILRHSTVHRLHRYGD